MNKHAENKIEEIYQLALKLGLEARTDMEKSIFKKSLAQIAVCAVDDIRGDVGILLLDKSRSYENA